MIRNSENVFDLAQPEQAGGKFGLGILHSTEWSKRGADILYGGRCPGRFSGPQQQLANKAHPRRRKTAIRALVLVDSEQLS
jgi:hypothetical protein